MFRRKKRERNMRKIFQWQEYLNWKDLTPQQKINFKRACFFPLLVYIVYSFLEKFTFSILIIIAIYFYVRYLNKNKLTK